MGVVFAGTAPFFIFNRQKGINTMKDETLIEIVSMIKQISYKQSKLEKESYYTLIHDLSVLLESKIAKNLSNFNRNRKSKIEQNDEIND
jgi:hypothetical protein